MLLIASMVTAPAFAVDYLSVEQAQALLFPMAVRWQEKSYTLSPEQLQAIAKSGSVPARSAGWPRRFTTGPRGGLRPFESCTPITATCSRGTSDRLR